MTIDRIVLYFEGRRADTVLMESNTTERADMDYFTEGDFQHDAAVEDAMIAAEEALVAAVAAAADDDDWRTRADEDWDYYNDSDVGF